MLARACTVTNELEAWAPLRWGEEWDNIGYIVGHPQAQIGRIVIALDLTRELVAAASNGALVICHHPPVLPKDLRTLRRDQPSGELLSAAIEKQLVVYVAHTNLDVAPGGTADALAERLGLQEVKSWSGGAEERYCKLVVFVPLDYQASVREALARAGAGWIGNYSHCTFASRGQGTFLPGTDTNPFIGRAGEVELVDEYRLETILPESLISPVVEAMIAAHPYEEVAYDLYPLLNSGQPRSYGRWGQWPQQGSLEQLASHVAACLQVEGVHWAGESTEPLQRIAVVPGSGGGQVAAAAACGAQALVTGDIGYHQAQLALALGLAVIDAGHQATEWPVLEQIAQRVRDMLPKEAEQAIEIWRDQPLLRLWARGNSSHEGL